MAVLPTKLISTYKLNIPSFGAHKTDHEPEHIWWQKKYQYFLKQQTSAIHNYRERRKSNATPQPHLLDYRYHNTRRTVRPYYGEKGFCVFDVCRCLRILQSAQIQVLKEISCPGTEEHDWPVPRPELITIQHLKDGQQVRLGWTWLIPDVQSHLVSVTVSNRMDHKAASAVTFLMSFKDVLHCFLNFQCPLQGTYILAVLCSFHWPKTAPTFTKILPEFHVQSL